jgi:hypothetical protein
MATIETRWSILRQKGDSEVAEVNPVGIEDSFFDDAGVEWND